MAITIDWATRIIYVPRADLTLLQSTPVEIREMDLNWFRLSLKDLEDDAIGIVFPDTHRHNTEVSLGGLIYARVIEIINGYTVTFEDGQYAVNLVGANSNVGDVVNVNQVSIRTQNSAGLISSSAIEFSSFNEGVTIDVLNGVVGTVFPRGTLELPVNNLADAKIIANSRGLEKLYIIGDITFGATDVLDGYTIVGQNPIKSTFTLIPGLSSVGCEFTGATIDGVLDGNSLIEKCIIEDLTYIEGIINECILKGTIVLSGSMTTNILNCHDGVAGDDKPVIDMGGSGQSLTVGAYCGELEIRNKNGTDKVSIDVMAGEIVLDSTVTNGEIDVRGVGRLIDNSTGTTEVNWTALISRDDYNEVVYVDTSSAQTGTNFPSGTNKAPVNNLSDGIAIAESLGINVIEIKGSVSIPSTLNGFILRSSFYTFGNIDLNNQDVSFCVFDSISITGSGTGFFHAKNCSILSGMSNVNADFRGCILMGAFSVLPTGSLRGRGCVVPGITTSFDLNNNGNLSLSDTTGIFVINNISSPSSFISITGNAFVTLSSSCVGGSAFLVGIGSLTDQSNGTTVIDKIVPGAVWDELRISHDETGTFGATDEWASATNVDAIADAVWDEESDEHDDDNTMGELQNKIDSITAARPKIVPGG